MSKTGFLKTIGVIATLGIGATIPVGVIAVNNANSEDKITVTKGDNVLLGDKVTVPETGAVTEVEKSELDKFCVENKVMLLCLVDLDGSIQHTIQAKMDNGNVDADGYVILDNLLNYGQIGNTIHTGWSLTENGSKIEKLPCEEKAVILYPVFEEFEAYEVYFYFNSNGCSSTMYNNNTNLPIDAITDWSNENYVHIGYTPVEVDYVHGESEFISIQDMPGYVNINKYTNFYAVYQNTETGEIVHCNQFIQYIFQVPSEFDENSYGVVGEISTPNEAEAIAYAQGIMAEAPEGKVFMGWSTMPNDASQIVDFNSIETMPGTSFFAIFEDAVNIITFTVTYSVDSSTATYQAEEGMTFAEWINSEYNTDGYAIYDHSGIANLGANTVGANVEYRVLTEDGVTGLQSDAVIQSIEYTLVSIA